MKTVFSTDNSIWSSLNVTWMFHPRSGSPTCKLASLFPMLMQYPRVHRDTQQGPFSACPLLGQRRRVRYRLLVAWKQLRAGFLASTWQKLKSNFFSLFFWIFCAGNLSYNSVWSDQLYRFCDIIFTYSWTFINLNIKAYIQDTHTHTRMHVHVYKHYTGCWGEE